MSDELLFTGQLESDQIQSVEDLIKAMEAGYAISPDTQTGGGALRLEDLEGTLKSTTFNETHCALWNRMHRDPAFSTIVEYSRLTDVGTAQSFAEGGIPEESDVTLDRRYEKVKFIGTIGKVAIPLTYTRTITDPWVTQTQGRTLACIRKIDQDLYFARDSWVSNDINGLLYHVETHATSDNIIDLEGKRLSPEIIGQGAQVIADNYGMGSIVFLSNQAKRNWTNHLIATKTWFVGQPVVTSGISPQRWEADHGEGDIVNDVFLNWATRKAPTAATSIKAPATPTGSAAASAGGKLADDTHYYKITAINNWGESAPLALNATTSGSNNTITFTLADGGGSQPAEAFVIYKENPPADGATNPFYWVYTYKHDATSIVDDRSRIPNTDYAFMIDWNPTQVFNYRQLINFFALPLALIDFAQRKLFVLAGTPVVYNARKIVVFKNCGSTAWA